MTMSDNLRFEQLEERRLLAVSVTTGKQGLLSIVGDNDGDIVRVNGTGVSGAVDVFVNGGFVGTFGGIKTIKANLKGGDDTLELSAIHIGGAVDVDMGQGEDGFAIDTLVSAGGIPGFAGNVFIGGSLICKMGNNVSDDVALNAGPGGPGLGITIGNNVTISGVDDVDLQGDGGSFNVQDADINIGGFLKISGNSPSGGDLFINDVNVGGTTIISLGGGDDEIHLTDSSFGRRLAVSLAAGDDLIDADKGPGEQNRFAAEVVVNGGKGTDTVDGNPLDEFLAGPPVLNRVENVS
jgi:hypothetical protein